MNWTGILAGLGGLLLAWPSIKPRLSKLPLVGSLVQEPVEPKPECFANLSARPPEWLKEWVRTVENTAGGRVSAEFIVEQLRERVSLFEIALLARDYKAPDPKEVGAK